MTDNGRSAGSELAAITFSHWKRKRRETHLLDPALWARHFGAAWARPLLQALGINLRLGAPIDSARPPCTELALNLLPAYIDVN